MLVFLALMGPSIGPFLERFIIDDKNDNRSDFMLILAVPNILIL